MRIFIGGSEILKQFNCSLHPGFGGKSRLLGHLPLAWNKGSYVQQITVCYNRVFPNTNLTFLAFLYKIDVEGFQKVSVKNKLPQVGIELMTLNRTDSEI